MSTSKLLQAPININLDGNFVIPRGADKYVAGQINPDLRLEHLDAFLQQLEAAFKEVKDKDGYDGLARLNHSFGAVIASAAERLRRETGGSCTLSISMTLDPSTHAMTYDFVIKSAA